MRNEERKIRARERIYLHLRAALEATKEGYPELPPNEYSKEGFPVKEPAKEKLQEILKNKGIFMDGDQLWIYND